MPSKKIFLTCGEQEVRSWAAFMLANMSEVKQSLHNEGVRYEAWYLGRDEGDGCLFLVGVMDVDDATAAHAVSAKSTLEVDKVHREFKKHWDRKRSEKEPKLQIDPSTAPDLELLFEARP